MAIRLASAIGEQRENVDVFGGLAGIISKTGDALQAQKEQKRKEAANKADQEQKLKDAIAASTDYETIDAHPEDNEKYKKDGEEGIFNIIKMSHTPGVTSAQLAEERRKFKLDLAEKKIKYEGDWKKIKEAAVAQGNTHETQYFADFVQKGTPDTEEEQVVPVDPSSSAINKVEKERIESQRRADLEGVENEDAINEINAKYDNDVLEIEKKAPTPIVKKVTKKGQPSLLSLPWDERKKIDINAKYDELAIPIIPNTIDVAKSIPSFGKDFEYKDFVTTTTTSKGELKYGIDVEGIKKRANFYADEVVERKLTPYSKEFMQYQNALTKMATHRVAQDVKEADFQNSGELVKDNVRKQAYQAFYDDAMREAEAQTIRLREAREKTAGKKGGFSISVGNGGENSLWKFGKPAKTNIREGATFKREKDKDGNEVKVPVKKGELNQYEYISMQTKTPTSNPVMVVNGENLYYQGVVKEVGGDKVVKYKFNTKADNGGEDRFIAVEKLNPSTISDIKTNVGEDDFEKAAAIGKYAPKKETTKAAPKTYKIGNKEWSADKVEKAAKASNMSVDEYIKEIQK